MKAIALLILSSLMLQAEPSTLTDTRKVYEEEKRKLDDKYLTWLESKMVSSEGDDRKAFHDEISKISGDEDPLIESDWGKVITVDSQDKGGYKLGRLKAGDVVKIQYQMGIWRAYTGWRDESPDSANIEHHKLAFVMSTREGDTTITTISKTVDEPFTYVIIEPGEYYIRINDPVIDSNFGKVQYKIEVK